MTGEGRRATLDAHPTEGVRMNKRTTLILVTTAVLAGLAWIGPVYIPMIMLGPIVLGAAFGTAGHDSRVAAMPWLAAGIITLVVDAVVNAEDIAFHAVVAVSTGLVAAGCSAAARRVAARRAQLA
jgi:hypothetical protein